MAAPFAGTESAIFSAPEAGDQRSAGAAAVAAALATGNGTGDRDGGSRRATGVARTTCEVSTGTAAGVEASVATGADGVAGADCASSNVTAGEAACGERSETSDSAAFCCELGQPPAASKIAAIIALAANFDLVPWRGIRCSKS